MIKGIMFDMDNTLIQSKIDFIRMKEDIIDFLIQINILPIEFEAHRHTTSTLIEYVRGLGISSEHYETMMVKTAQHECLGMKEAGLEPGAMELLESLKGRYTLVVITNNSVTAALEALEHTHTHISQFFDLIIGREQMTAMKPSPSGFHYMISQFPMIKLNEWISIGDSWIDGAASIGAGIPFISYRGDAAKMHDRGVLPIARMNHLLELEELLLRW